MSTLPGMEDTPGDVRKNACLSDDAVYRYTLTRDWSDPSRFVRQLATFVMLNPSTADATDHDPTIRRCMKFARSWGLDGIRVVNLYAFRASRPPVMWAALAAGTDVIGPENEHMVRKALLQAYNTCAPVIAAWGNNGAVERVGWLRREAASVSVDLQCLGTTLSGSPKHPLARGQHRIPDDTRPIPWSA